MHLLPKPARRHFPTSQLTCFEPHIVNLPRRERERDWIAGRLDGRVDFRRQSATRAADRLIRAVFFWAPAIC
jgi:hypothetical protein